MKVNDLITAVESEYDSPYSTQNKLDWINELELRYKLEVDKDLGIFEISRQANVAGYNLPEDVQFNDLLIVYIDGRPADYIDLTSFQQPGYYKGTGGKFTVYPVPTISDATSGIRGTYIVRPTKKVITDIETDDLLIPDDFINVYKYWIFFKIALLTREFGEADNWTILFNDEFKKLSKWIQRTKPVSKQPSSKNVL